MSVDTHEHTSEDSHRMSLDGLTTPELERIHELDSSVLSRLREAVQRDPGLAEYDSFKGILDSMERDLAESEEALRLSRERSPES